MFRVLAMALSEKELYLLEIPSLGCEDFEGSLFEFFEGELCSTASEKMREHCSVCAQCERSLTDYRLTVELAAHLGDFSDQTQPEALPDGVEERLHNVLRQRLGLSLMR
jgi:hypothetical protein